MHLQLPHVLIDTSVVVFRLSAEPLSTNSLLPQIEGLNLLDGLGGVLFRLRISQIAAHLIKMRLLDEVVDT